QRRDSSSQKASTIDMCVSHQKYLDNSQLSTTSNRCKEAELAWSLERPFEAHDDDQNSVSRVKILQGGFALSLFVERENIERTHKASIALLPTSLGLKNISIKRFELHAHRLNRKSACSQPARCCRLCG